MQSPPGARHSRRGCCHKVTIAFTFSEDGAGKKHGHWEPLVPLGRGECFSRTRLGIYDGIYIGARSGDVLVHVCVRASVADLGKMCGWPELGSVPLTNHTCSFAPPPSPNPAASPTLRIQQFLSSCQSCAKGHPCKVSTMKQRSAA